MAIIAKKKRKQQFAQPADGITPALVLDARDLGMRGSQWGEKHKIQLVYMTAQLDPQGQPILVSDFPTLSLHEQSRLYATIVAITGEEPGDDFDVESLLGRQCRILTKRSKPNADGIYYANVREVLPPGTGDPELVAPLDYVRLNDRVKASKANGRAKPLTAKKPQVENIHGLEITDRDIPF
jgi:hypothetical protein